ncbi:MAG: GNAT family protein [Armatimonadaceae bacterium]
MSQPLPPRLPEEVLAKAASLPKKPAPVFLTGKIIRLEPFAPAQHLEPLYAVGNGEPIRIGEREWAGYDPDEAIWRFMSAGPFPTLADFQRYMQMQYDAPDGTPFAVFSQEWEHPVGVVNLMANYPGHLKIELGSIWYSPIAQRTGANTEATYLLLKHLFDLGYRRVEWKCNVLNERSRQAAEKMGFRFEGIQECHYIFKGRSRDTAWLRLLDREWEDVKRMLEARLYG